MKGSITIIVAVAENGVIGSGGGLPWRMPSDLRHFRRMTLGKPVIMGRKTFQSIGKPLDGRDNIVVSRDPDFRPAGVEVATSLPAAIERGRARAAASGVDEVMVIGGAEIYRAALPHADRVRLTRIKGRPGGDATFPDPDPRKWREVGRETLPRGPNDDFDAEIVVLERKA